MAYKLHSEFTKQAQEAIDKRLPSIKDEIRHGLLMDMVYLSRMGLLPEGATGEEQRRVNGIVPSRTPLVEAVERGDFPTVVEEMQKVSPIAFSFGTQSIERLKVVHPKLRACAELAITLTCVDFRIGETLRSAEQQKANVAKGVSRTMKSKHFKQTDGWVWAMDCIALTVQHTVTWDEDSYVEIAYAFDVAATQLGVAGHIRWGAAWDRVLSDFGGSSEAYLNEARAYAKRHAGSDLIDMPHFEWVA